MSQLPCSQPFPLANVGLSYLLTFSAWGLMAAPLFAQSITPATDGTGTTVITNNNTYHIQGGTQAGANLFHSFQDFGLNAGETANFLSDPSVTNILGRVVGSSPSMIDGLIQVSGANSNLYLMNPAGIVFGSNASLNVAGDFTATTATGIEFSDGTFSAYDNPDYASLVSQPQGFIVETTTPGAVVNAGDLTVRAGQNLSLLGGTVLNTGTITALDGNINLAAVPGQRRLKITQPGMLLSLEVDVPDSQSNVQPLDLPHLLTGTGLMPNSEFEPGDIANTGKIVAQDVTLMAAGRVKPSNPTFIQTHNGAATAPTVLLFSEDAADPLSVIAIDSRVDNPLELLYGGQSGTVSTIINPDEDGVAAIADQLNAVSEAGYQVDALNIVAEGNAGNIWLGNEWLTHDNVEHHQAQLQAWGSALTNSADILLYSCFTALGATGEALMASMAELTGADVAASVDATGSANYGGNWELERSTGSIEATNPFTTEILDLWDGKLATITVTNLNNTGAGSLREAIQTTAVAGDLITFAVSGTITLAGTVSGTDGEIRWATDNLTLDGNSNITLDGNGNSRIFNITANNATIQNISLQNGSSATSGGGILHTGSGLLQLNTASVFGNSSGSRGGGIYSQGAVTLNSSTVTSNSATDRGGGVVAFGDVNLNNSTVSRNFSDERGGGIRSLSDVTLSNSTVSNNSANNVGGGIANFGTVTVQNSTIANNTAARNGGGVHTYSTVNVNNATISGNSANGDGGGISAGGAVSLLNGTIAFNQADADANGTGDGGGLFITGTQTNQIVNSILARNSDSGSEAPDINADLSSSTVQHSLIQDPNGVTGLALTNGVNGNLIGQDPQLAALANNGGPTQTHALQAGSPALNAGNNGFAAATDQRGQARISDGQIDLGAVEEIIPTPTPPPTPTPAPPVTYTPVTPIATGEIAEPVAIGPVIIRDRIDQLLSSEQICAAVEMADQHHTQEFRQHFGQFALEDPLSCDEMQRQLPEDAMLVSVFANADDLHLVTLTDKGDPNHYSIPVSRETVLARLAEFQQSLTNPVLRKSDRFLAPSQQLYDWIVKPLLPELESQGTKNILFTLGDGLRTMPLAALHDGEQFLIEQYQASLIPSLSLTPTGQSDLQDAGVLAMGISEFNKLSSLPAVPIEIASIQQKFPKATSLINDQVTLSNFQSHLKAQPRQIVHLATHGNFQAGEVENSYIQFWNEQLNLKEIEQVDWSSAAVELLILSACQTALGDQSVEYGFAGLAVQARAGAAIAGLWNTNDAATLALMRELYRQLSLGIPKGEALRQAQLALMQGTVHLDDQQLVGAGQKIALPSEFQKLGDRTFWHPYYWSAFTLIGNPW